MPRLTDQQILDRLHAAGMASPSPPWRFVQWLDDEGLAVVPLVETNGEFARADHQRPDPVDELGPIIQRYLDARYYTCLACGALVDERLQEFHGEWHGILRAALGVEFKERKGLD